ncbi:MAG: HAMP domain-containing protein, partial [Frankiaceae bacterium]|nr:HAMP domain-containing protein [Frankiaceae bacterium]
LLGADGTVLRATPGLPAAPLLTVAEVRDLDAPRFFTKAVPGVQGQARLLAVPLHHTDSGKVLIVGETAVDRRDALDQLLVVLAVGGPIAVGVASYAGWRVAGWAMRPVARIQHEASAITASGLDRRIELPPAQDELYRLTETLNDMLARLDDALSSERRFLQQASHELRTPLAALKAELDLARSAPRSAAELTAAVASAAEETDRLARLADDLLALARAHDGRLPVRREMVDLRELVHASVDLFAARAGERDQRIEADVPPTLAFLDPMRVRQALDNVLDNALRHTRAGVTVQLSGEVHGPDLVLTVTDSGPGFDQLVDGHQGGLGLRIAEAVAVSHGGRLDRSNAAAGGAVVRMTFAGVVGQA